ncbi:hypothetical protein EX895_005283 [Sporisorium graminicola]|uniref:L-ornithine N(5)-monooxygenase n=1 Tax=Sporisorium graminicola TaxID=280036 RepID=A0A4U7KNJ9_9BASI|nr:hypothetical protein EX895_005283 [Sporisorium graminicola]TKY85743.1 hypothetical protein EX895_005283 [Sporisorium graminicola]
MLPPHRKTPETLIMPEELETAQVTPGQTPTTACQPTLPAPSRLSLPGVDAAAHFDLVIIGAGPAALAVISRILESRPAALYTEDEHRHLHFTHRQRTPALIPSKVARASKTSKASISRELQEQTRQGSKKKGKALWNVGMQDPCQCDGRIKILVIDKLGEGFLGLWRRNFRALKISHLRSPMFFHPDASDFDALIAYANQQGQAGEGTPDQVVDLIEQKIAAGKPAPLPRGTGCRRRSRGSKRSASPEAETGSNAARLPDLIEILGVVGKEKSKHKRKQQLQQPKEHHSSAVAATSTKVHVNERDRRDYFTPSSDLFDSFTRQLEHKYRVQSSDSHGSSTWPSISQFFDSDAEEHSSAASVPDSTAQQGAGLDESPVTTVKGVVKDLVWFDGSKQTVQDDFGNHSPGFLLELADGVAGKSATDDAVVISAKAVVSAVGFGGVPMIPPYLSATRPTNTSAAAPTKPPPTCGPGWMHSSCLATLPFPLPPALAPTTRARERTMVVVGGGLTSAQIVVRALEEGYDKVVLLTRGHLKSKPFDVDLGWVGRYSNYLKMQFWQNEDVQERLTTLRAARNGGSVTPTYAKVLARLQALGKVEVRTHTTIAAAVYAAPAWHDRQQRRKQKQEDEERADSEQDDGGEAEDSDQEDAVDDGDRQWSLELRTSSAGGNLETIRADYLCVATGAKIDFGGLPFLQQIQKTHPVRLVGGLPVVTADLEYRRDVPLFVTGAYAGLQIGPAAGNLGGMRDSADRIANRLLELLSLPEGVVPNVVSLPETVVPRLRVVHPQDDRGTSETAEASPPNPVRKDRSNRRPDRSAAFTHFNFDLLSIEA